MISLMIYGSPVAPFQKVYIMKDNQITDTLGVEFENLAEVVVDLCKKYQVNHIDLSGATLFMQGVEKQITESMIATNYELNDIRFRYL